MRSILKLALISSLLIAQKNAFGQWSGQQLALVPAYFYPGEIWDRMISVGAGIVIANPDSGPGAALDDNYVKYIQKARDAGIAVIGYVPTTYGKRSIDDVKSDIDKYFEWYNINGIFFDEVKADAEFIDYYHTASDHVKNQGENYVVLNPGTTPTSSAFKDISDVIVIHETSLSEFGSLEVPEWLQSDPYAVSIMYHTTGSSEEMVQAVLKSKEKNAGYVYITDDGMPNPYDQLPTFYEDEVQLLESPIESQQETTE